MNTRALRIVLAVVLGLGLMLGGIGAAGAQVEQTSAQWLQLYHQTQQSRPPSMAWPAVAALHQQAMAAARDGSVPIAVLDLEAAGVFAAAALRPVTYRGNRVIFRLDPRFSFSDRGGELPRLRLDCDDGQGWRDTEIGAEIAAVYTSTGPRTLRLEAIWPGGRRAEARLAFSVLRLVTPPPHETWSLTADIPYGGGLGSGLAYIYLAEGHAQLTNPVVVLEGFDLDNSINWDEIYALMNQEQLLESLRGEGFDIVALNFGNANDFIQRHAFLTVALLQRIASEAPAAEVIVVGASMGGLVGRYALAYLEHNALPHDVSSYISFDAPQQGAGIPLGLQHWVDFFAAESADAAQLRNILLQASPRQMLVYHFDASPPGSAGSDPLRQVLQSELQALGEYPQLPRCVSVANGSGTAQDQGFNAGWQLIHYEYESFLLDIIGNVWSVPDGSNQIIFRGLIDRPWPLEDDERTVTVSGAQPYDSAPGGSRPSMAQLVEAEVPYGEIVALRESHCFIPTVSALNIATDDLFHDIAGDPDIMALTPFDAIYYPAENQEHIRITPESKVWFMDEIRGVLSAADEYGAEVPVSRVGLSIHPNPFNPRTTISFELVGQQQASVAVFDLRGRRVATLVDQFLAAGRHTLAWNATDAAGRVLPSGTYVVQLNTAGQRHSETITLVR